MTSSLAFPPALRVEGTVRVPGSKSATNRALLLAALSERPVTVAAALDSDDIRTLAACLETMGARFQRVSDGISISGPLGLTAGRGPATLFAGDSGTAARFLAAVASAVPGEFLLTGSPRLSERPMGELVEALRSLGADIREEGTPGRLPLRIRGGSLSGGSVRADASRSSQFLSALLLAAAARRTGGALEIAAAGAIASAPYVRVTIDALRAFGHDVEGGDAGGGPWRVSPGGSPPERYEVPGDFSSAVPLLAAAGICGGEVRLHGLAWPSPDADALALPVLAAMGIEISAAPGEISARGRRGALRPGEFSASDFPDAVPALAALASFAHGETRFSGVAHLRWKESDRLDAMAALLSAAGAASSSLSLASVTGGAVEADDPDVAGGDTLLVRGPGTRTGAGADGTRAVRLPTFRDHRIAMAAGLLALARPGLLIEDPDCVSKSYPAFFRDLDRICRR